MNIYLKKIGIVATATAINVYVFSLFPRNFPQELAIHAIALTAIQGVFSGFCFAYRREEYMKNKVKLCQEILAINAAMGMVYYATFSTLIRFNLTASSSLTGGEIRYFTLFSTTMTIAFSNAILLY